MEEMAWKDDLVHEGKKTGKVSRFGRAADKRARELGIDREEESKHSVREFVTKCKEAIIV